MADEAVVALIASTGVLELVQDNISDAVSNGLISCKTACHSLSWGDVDATAYAAAIRSLDQVS
jgi:hypothetical protein